MLSFISSLLQGIFALFKFLLVLLIPCFAILFVIILCLIYQYVYMRYIKHIKPKKLNNNLYFSYNDINYVLERKYKEPIKQDSFFKKIFYLFPKQFVYDRLTYDPNAFGEYGIHMIVGDQGSGKSMTAVYLLEEWKKKWPKIKIFTNMGYRHENGELEYWQQLIERKNGKYGIVNVIDDLKAWWSNKDSKDLPPEVLGEICQQRKQKKAIIGTIQVYSEAPKPLRSQTHYIYVPKTFLGCLTIVKKTKRQYYNPEKDCFTKSLGYFFFPHTKRLREAYDTYKKIEKYKDTVFSASPYFDSAVAQGSPVGK